jgi:glucose-6-phosphate isomerase
MKFTKDTKDKEFILPFSLNLDLGTGVFASCNNYIQRHLGQMAGMYADQEAVQKLLVEGDPLLYEVYQYDVPFENGQLLVVTTVLHPGKVGDEYYMTKGHYHARKDTAEVYLGLRGRGWLLMQTDQGEFQSIQFEQGTVGYIPPHWAHRMVNTGQEDFIFYGVYPADAGHDYGSIETTGFPYLVLEGDGQPSFVVNPSYV